LNSNNCATGEAALAIVKNLLQAKMEQAVAHAERLQTQLEDSEKQKEELQRQAAAHLKDVEKQQNENKELFRSMKRMELENQELSKNLNDQKVKRLKERDAYQREKEKYKQSQSAAAQPADEAKANSEILKLKQIFENVGDTSVHIEPFSGAGYMTVTDWIVRLREIASLREWSDDQTLRKARLALIDPARSAVLNYKSEIVSLQQLEKFLQERYGIRDAAAHYIDKMSRLSQGVSETGKKFCDRFSTLKRHLDDVSTIAMPPKTYLTWFIRALRPRFRTEVERAKALQKIDLLAAMKLVRDCDKFVFLEAQPDEFGASDSSHKVAVNSISALEQKIEDLSRKISQSGQNVLEKCQICSQFTHTARFCPNLQQLVLGPVTQANNRNFQKNVDRSKLVCTYCGKARHSESECWEKHGRPQRRFQKGRVKNRQSKKQA